MRRTALILQTLAPLLMAFGLWLLWPWLGITVLGLLIIVGGVVMELEARDGSG